MGDWTRGDSRVLPLLIPQPEGREIAPARHANLLGQTAAKPNPNYL